MPAGACCSTGRAGNWDPAISIAEGIGRVRANGVDQVVGEFLGGDVQDLQSAGGAHVSDRMQQVRLAQSDAAVDEQRVVRGPWPLGDGLRHSVRHAIRRPDDEGLKGIAWVQVGSMHVRGFEHPSLLSHALAGRALVRPDGTLEDVRLALGSVAPTPLRARRTEGVLDGKRPAGATRREALLALEEEIQPIDDVRAPARYRRIAAAVVLDRFLTEASSA